MVVTAHEEAVVVEVVMAVAVIAVVTAVVVIAVVTAVAVIAVVTAVAVIAVVMAVAVIAVVTAVVTAVAAIAVVTAVVMAVAVIAVVMANQVQHMRINLLGQKAGKIEVSEIHPITLNLKTLEVEEKEESQVILKFLKKVINIPFFEFLMLV